MVNIFKEIKEIREDIKQTKGFVQEILLRVRSIEDYLSRKMREEKIEKENLDKVNNTNIINEWFYGEEGEK